jgi:hypothetical protein
MPSGKSQAEESRRLRQIVKKAFLQVRDGFSPDRVVADPEMNAQFLQECADFGAGEDAPALNRRLLNLRKQGELPALQSKRTRFAAQTDYEFASEITMRFLERRDGVTLDDVICDPDRAAEFDRLAASLAPGYSALQYRWGALSLRKNRRLLPEPIGRVIQPIAVEQHRADTISTMEIPTEQGLYVFYSTSACLYVGEASNLRSRLRKHLDHSDNRGLARWLWEHGTEAVNVEWQVLPPTTPARSRKAMECELIRSRRPLFNVVYVDRQ